jgi:hypothetical protein
MAAFGGKNWQQRRARRMVWLRPLVALVLVAVPFFSSWLAFGLTGAQEKLASWSSLQLALSNFPLLKALVNNHPVLVVFVFMYLGALLRSKATTEKLHDRAFGEFNDNLFFRIQSPRSATGDGWTLDGGALPFLKPDTGARRKVWTALQQLTSEDIGDGRTWLPWSTPDIPQPLLWMIILGRPGSGKSRMVQEFARQLGQRALLGDPSKKWAGRWFSLGAWWRRIAWFLKRRNDDPWDAGLLHNSSFSSEALANWQPARPTLLWLDDPEPGAAEKWIATLAQQRTKWMHPVRLVICNQSMPEGLGHSIGQSEARCREIEAVPNPIPPQLLTASARFNAVDIRQLVRGISESISDRQKREHLQQLWKTENIDRLLAVTRGNPLLVELAIDWHRRHLKIADMSEDELLAERAQRVLTALAAAGVDGKNHQGRLALAAGTLVGPRAPKGPIQKAFGKTLPVGEELRNLVPSDTDFDPKLELPAIRPEMIGDAVVRAIIAIDDPEGNAGEIVKAGFKASPGGWLRAVERCGRKADELGRALDKKQPIEAGDLDGRSYLALAWMNLALYGHREPVELAETITDLITGSRDPAALREKLWTDFQERVVDDAAQRIASINAHSARLAGTDLATQVEADEDEDDIADPLHCFMRGKCIALIGGILRVAGQPTALAWDQTLAELAQLDWITNAAARRGISFWTDADGDCWTRSIAFVFAKEDVLDDDQVKQLHDWSLKLPFGAFEIKSLLRQGLAVRLAASPQARARSLAETALALAQPNSSVACAVAVDRVEAITSQVANLHDRDMQYERATAWGTLAFAQLSDPAASAISVNRVEAITSQAAYMQDRDMQLERANTRRLLAYFQKNDPVACAMAVDRVEAITSQAAYTHDRDMQSERAQAWRILAFAQQSDPVACATAVDRVEAITSQAAYMQDRDMQRERAEAWRHLAFTQKNDPVACARAVVRVEAITNQLAYLNDRGMQHERAQAWRHLAYTQKNDPVACARAVDRVKAITSQITYLHDRDMQYERAQAWRVLAFAQQSDPVACARTVDRVEAITSQITYLYDRDMQYERAQAWRGLAFAQQSDPMACAMAVDRVEAITNQLAYLNDRDMHYQRAQAWRHLAYTQKNDPAACARTVDRVEVLASQVAYQHDRDMQLERTHVWRFLAFAHRHAPEAYDRVIAKVRAIVAPWQPGARSPFHHDTIISEQLPEAAGYASSAAALPDPLVPIDRASA